MEFQGQLHDLDRYYLERRELEVRNGALHAEIWRLGKEEATGRKRELAENTVRMRTLTYLIDKIRLQACLR